MSSNFIKTFYNYYRNGFLTDVMSNVKILLLNGLEGIFNKSIVCIIFNCVVIIVVQLFNIFLFLVDKVNDFNLYYRSCYVEVLQR